MDAPSRDSSSVDWVLKAVCPLRVTIIGAGIAGLTTAIGLKRSGHSVTILERVNEIKDVGAGIQIAPNAARIYHRFGILEKLLEKGTILTSNSIRKYDTNEECTSAPFGPEFAEKYGAPLFVMHRGDLQRILLERAISEGVDLRLGCKVVKIDKCCNARLRLDSGGWIKGDLILAADGIKSVTRAHIANYYGFEDRSWSSGDAVYRIMVPVEKMKHDEEAMRYMRQNVGMRWMGPDSHLMAYPVRNNTVYNMVLVHPEKPQRSHLISWSTTGDKQEMLDEYKDWSTSIRKLLDYAPEGEIMEWSLNLQDEIPMWLPYLAQGASQAIEDAGVLVTALALSQDMTTALEVYQSIRQPRMEVMHEMVAVTRKNLHMKEGAELLQRDQDIKQLKQPTGSQPDQESALHPDRWADGKCQDFMYGVDVMLETYEKLCKDTEKTPTQEEEFGTSDWTVPSQDKLTEWEILLQAQILGWEPLGDSDSSTWARSGESLAI
ncbi:hypothetical protein MMC25_007704 [Agyrium rufum]|nr:hypothetical protein [Agyrium rufum]